MICFRGATHTTRFSSPISAGERLRPLAWRRPCYQLVPRHAGNSDDNIAVITSIGRLLPGRIPYSRRPVDPSIGQRRRYNDDDQLGRARTDSLSLGGGISQYRLSVQSYVDFEFWSSMSAGVPERRCGHVGHDVECTERRGGLLLSRCVLLSLHVHADCSVSVRVCVCV